MSHFFRSGNTYKVAPGGAVDIREELPAGNYVLKYSMLEGFYLEISDSFRMPKRIYGDCLKNSSRILSTFRNRASNTGVLLSGEKGSGKTLLARQIGIESGLPVIIINTEFKGDNFNSFLLSITQPCIVFLDEFEKVYNRESQEHILTLLDGTYQSQKLFLLTCNDKWKIDVNMRNRPGRLFYFIEFGGLDEDFIVEYCEENLKDKGFTREVLNISKLFDVFNFDLLNAFVEEINRYGESPKQLIELLNAKPEYSGEVVYTVDLQIGDHKVIPAVLGNCAEIQINTTSDEFCLNLYYHINRDHSNFATIVQTLNELEPEEDCDSLINWIKSGDIKLVSYSNRYHHDEDVTHNDFTLEFEPQNISLYTPEGGIQYLLAPGIVATLTRSRKRAKTRGRFG